MSSAKFESDPEQQNTHTAGFAERVRANQQKLTADLKPHYDFIVCGSGSSGSVVARRLAEDGKVSVLLLEAGGSDDMPSIMEADQWPLNIGSERDWGFMGQPNPHLNGRSIPLNMGKILGGGSSINLMGWARGHKNDWDFFAAEARDAAWSYESVLNIYRRIEDWHGTPDPRYRGTGGPVFVQPAPDPNPVAPAMVEGARSGWHSDLPKPERADDGRRWRCLYHGLASPRRNAAIGIPFLCLPLHGPAEPDGALSRAGHSTCHER